MPGLRLRTAVRSCVVLALVMVVTTGCAFTGPAAIRQTRAAYNAALQRTEDEQLLLNLVRLRYRDRPLFLQTTALNTQWSFSSRANAGVEFGPQTNEVMGVAAEFEAQERPTVSYRPLQGEDFVKQLLTPISLGTLVLLSEAGWSSERIFRCCVERLGALPNAPRADGPTPAEAPRFRDFVRAVRLLRSLEISDAIAGARAEGDEGLLLRVAAAARGREEYKEMTRLLGLDPALGIYRLTPSLGSTSRDALHVDTRSFLGVMYFLSCGVEVPDEHEEAGLVTISRDAEGAAFDWAELTEGIMRIRSSRTRPKEAAVAVAHRGWWYWIADADLTSKSTFSLLGQIFSLQAREGSSGAPVLTLPVGN